jgi:hypothetical protein
VVLSAWIGYVGTILGYSVHGFGDIGTLLGYSVHRLGMLVLYLGTQCMDSGILVLYWGTQCMDWVCWYYTGVLSAWIPGYWYSTGVLWYLQSNVCWYYATVLYYPLVPSFDWVFPCNRVRQ